MVFSHSEITAISFDKPNYSDKLLATINVMRTKAGQEKEDERILLKACQEIHPLPFMVRSMLKSKKMFGQLRIISH
jgi:hypothetical protein